MMPPAAPPQMPPPMPPPVPPPAAAPLPPPLPQPPAAAPAGPAAPAVNVTEQEITQAMDRLRVAAAASVARQVSQLNAAAAGKEHELALGIQNQTQGALADTQAEFDNITAARTQELEELKGTSDEHAKTAFKAVTDEIGTAVGVATASAISEVVTQAEKDTAVITDQAIDLQAKAKDLEDQAKHIDDVGRQSVSNARTYTNTIPAADALMVSNVSYSVEQLSLELETQALDTKRVAKMAAGLAIQTNEMTKEAYKRSKHAQSLAMQTVQQATANAQLLALIKKEAEAVRRSAMSAQTNAGAGMTSG